MKEILKKINEYKTIVIYRHQLADPDALGSQFGLANLIKDNFSDKEVYVLGSNASDLNGTLYPMMDEIKTINKPFLGIVLDTANVSRIDDESYLQADYLIKIDHHIIIEQYGNYNYEQVDAASTSSIITEMAQVMNWKMSVDAATYLYAGIVADSGRFLFNSTDAKTLSLASYLLSKGALMAKVYDTLYLKTQEEVALSSYILQNYTKTDKGVAYYVLNEADYLQFNISFEIAKNFVNTLAGIKGINIWASAVYNPESKKYNTSLRSRDYNVNEIAQKYGGGGHKLASGVKVCNESKFLEIIKDLDALLID